MVAAVLVLGCTRQTDEGNGAGLRQLQALDAGVELDESGEVTFVNLSHTAVTDDDLQSIGTLVSLRQLWLYDTQISDRGLTHLSGLVNLEVLVLGKTRITDRGLARLHPLRSLQELYLYETDTSARAVAELQQVLTRTIIVR